MRTRREKVQAVMNRIIKEPEFMLTEEYLKDDALQTPETFENEMLRRSQSTIGTKLSNKIIPNKGRNHKL